MPDEQLGAVFRVARSEPLVRGFAIGRTIFSEAAKQWFASEIDDSSATEKMRGTYQRLIDAWDRAGD